MSQRADVIELGSSDEEAEPAAPAPKKPKRLNNMVCIPGKNIPKKPIQVQRPGSSKVVVAPSFQNLIRNPFANKQLEIARNLVNGKAGVVRPPIVNMPTKLINQSSGTLRNSPQKIISNLSGKKIVQGKNIANLNINITQPVTTADMATAKNILKSMHALNPRPSFSTIPIKMASNRGTPLRPVRPQISKKALSQPQVPVKYPAVRNSAGKNPVGRSAVVGPDYSNPSMKKPSGPPQLPPGITVTRVTGAPNRRKAKRTPSPGKVTFKKQKVSTGPFEVLTVELDDDDDDIPVKPTTASPQWYVRPEDADIPIQPEQDALKEAVQQELEAVDKDAQSKDGQPTREDNLRDVEQVSSNQVENNKEPEIVERQMIEITIEDSPVKPPVTQASKMVSDLSVIIEDSPRKLEEEQQNDEKDGGGGNEEIKKVVKTPQSRKKLNFPQKGAQFIEVEVEFCNPIEMSVETDVPITEVINLDTPTKSVQESADSKTKSETIPIKRKLSPSNIKNKKQKCDTKRTEMKENESNDESNKILETNSSETSLQAVESLKEDKSNTVEFIQEIKSTEVTPAKDARSQQVQPKIELQNKLAKPAKESKVNMVDYPNESSRKTVKPDKKSETKAHESPKQDESNVVDPLGIETRDAVVDSSKDSCSPNSSKLIESSEFNETYQGFIDLCFKIENSEDMKKIVDKKVKGYYRQVDKSFTESKDFIDIVATKIMAMKLNPENLYLYIKDIVDELNMRRKDSKRKTVIEDKSKDTIEASVSDGAESEEAGGSNRNIRRLEKAMRKLHRAIHKLEEQEVDFDDDTDSVYLLTESKDGNSSKAKDKQLETDRQIQIQRYKARFVRVHAKLLQMTGTRMPSEAKVKLEARPGRPPGPTLRLEKWINKKVPAGAPRPFPDFHDVARCVREANVEDKLGWSEMEVMEEARDLFSRCGKELQRRRQANEWRIASSRIAAETDPADSSVDLKQKLNENKKLAAKRESDVINKYADRQNQLKLEAEEIGDNEVDESAPSSDDDVQAIDDEPDNNTGNVISPSKLKEKIVAEISKMTTESTAVHEIEVIDITKKRDTSEQIQDSEDDKNGNEKDSVTDITDCPSPKDQVILNEVNDVEESDSELLQLVLSDESNSGAKNNDNDSQSLLRQRSDVENKATSLESSDTDAVIPISETQDSADSQLLSTKSSEVESIENSSSDTNLVKDASIPSTPSKEKQLLLEIDESDEEADNIEQLKSSTGNSTENENEAACKSVVIGTTEEESNAYEDVIKETGIGFIQNSVAFNAEEESNACDPLDTEHISINSNNQSAPSTKPEENGNSETNISSNFSTNTNEADESTDSSYSKNISTINSTEGVMKSNLDTGKINSHGMLVDYMENTIIVGSIDIEPTIIQGALSVDDNESNSSKTNSLDENKKSHTPMDKLSVDNQENHSVGNQSTIEDTSSLESEVLQSASAKGSANNQFEDNVESESPPRNEQSTSILTLSDTETASQSKEIHSLDTHHTMDELTSPDPDMSIDVPDIRTPEDNASHPAVDYVSSTIDTAANNEKTSVSSTLNQPPNLDFDVALAGD